MKPRGYKYFNLRTIHMPNRFEFAAMDDFCRFSEMHNIREMYVLLNTNNEPEHFAVMYNNSLMQHSTNGFKSLEDYEASKQFKFPDAYTYYDASAGGYTNYQDYEMVKEAGISDKNIFEKVKTGGFIAGINDYLSIKENAAFAANDEVTNPYHLYQLAGKCGFESYSQFKDAILKGFTHLDTYLVASQYGFPAFADYEDAKNRGFKTFAELQEARALKVRDQNDLQRMKDLQYINCTDCAHDEKVLLILMSKLEQGKKVSINKLTDLFASALNDYRYEDTQQMPEWFISAFEGRESIIHYLLKNEQIKKYGNYDSDGEFFEINQMQDRKVMIDGSNVAHNSCNGNNGKPSVQNIIKLAKHLKTKGFTDISVIADASLKHRLGDADKIPQLNEIAEYLEAPARTSADAFIIEYVKNTRCLLVSNDTFREWKVNDPWVAENVDFYRLSFMIKGNEVLMPDVK